MFFYEPINNVCTLYVQYEWNVKTRSIPLNQLCNFNFEIYIIHPLVMNK